MWHGPHSTFLRSEKEKVKQRKKERVSKQKLLKGCHQGQRLTILGIEERHFTRPVFIQPSFSTANVKKKRDKKKVIYHFCI